MFFLLLSAVFIASGGGAEPEYVSCDASRLEECVRAVPRTSVGLPKNRQELDAHCTAYQMAMSCMDSWIKLCLPNDGQKLVQQQIGGARALMRYLCTNDSALRKEFLKEQACWARVSPDWTRCADELQAAVHDITERSQQLAYFNKNAELCCARDAFLSCVLHVGRTCTREAAGLLRRMAWVLAHDVAACPPNAHAVCTAPSPPSRLTAPVLTALSGFIIYPPRL